MPDDDDAIDLRGVLDINRIEAILRGISTRLSAQEAQLAAVVARADEHDTEQLQRVRATLDRALDSVDTRLAAFEARLQRQEAMQPRLTAIERHLDRVNHDLASKPEAEDYEQTRTSIRADLEALSASVTQRLADGEAVRRLEDGHRQLSRQLNAMQELMACKVDRVEVPLLESAGERVRVADEFRVVAGPRLARLEEALAQTQATLDAKEERAAVVERMQAIYAEFQKRPDRDTIEQRIELPLDELRKRVDVLQCDVSLIQPMEVGDALQELRNDVNRAIEDGNAVRTRIDQLDVQVRSRASVRLLEKKADRAWCEQLAHEITLKGDEKIAGTAATIAQIQKQVIELKQVQNTVDEKLAVSLRFLDWFSSVQLDKQIKPGMF
ncbi:unnamed protein product (mitochondrion) [Plasmodiophora brassicae]|uniref:Uncharacterized protein n=1 Tax=Plasmodiophora brassicae TaxID=37360 RepID=A0A0G4J5T2_PLABS|nr:hypothetical protein PBRA_002854 [Plasmodiophora brassicae]SPQ94992.1 unnamed protein product [Plasmodiophora brassicae]